MRNNDAIGFSGLGEQLHNEKKRSRIRLLKKNGSFEFKLSPQKWIKDAYIHRT